MLFRIVFTVILTKILRGSHLASGKAEVKSRLWEVIDIDGRIYGK
jgi:hypothetical protein